MSEIIPRVASTNSTSTCTAFQMTASFIETYTTDSLSEIFAALNISSFIIPFHCYSNNEYAQLWIRASATVWRALVLSPCLQEALPFHNCSTISSCNSFCSLPQPPASPQIGGMDTAVSAIPCQLSLLYSNCRSLVPKLDNLHAQANSLNPCITALTETWLDASISDHELCIPGYSVLCCDRNRWGSGVLLYVRSDLPILWTSSHHSLELLFVDIRLRQGNMLIGLFYRPPSAPVSIIDDLDATLSDIHPTRLSCTLLLGDFNINLLSATPNINPCFLPMKDLAGKFNLTQVVTEPTRCTNDSSSLIDHVDLFDASLLQSCLTPPPLCSSDHNCLLVKLNRVIPRQSSTSEPSGSTKELTSTLLPRNLKTMTVIIPSLTSTISGLTGKSLPSMSWPGTLPINELPSESLYPGSLMHCHSCSRNVIDYIKGLRPLILLLPGCPTERPGTGQWVLSGVLKTLQMHSWISAHIHCFILHNGGRLTGLARGAPNRVYQL